MKIGLLFSGQGAQSPGMMREIYENEPVAKELFDSADAILGRKISSLCFEGTQEELNLTHNTQPCMLACDIAAALVLKNKGVNAEATAGFSLGEYAALCYAGAVSIEDAFRIIQIRADAMQGSIAPGEGAMAAFIGTESSKIEELCSRVKSGYVVPANYNSPVQTVVSGTVAGVDEALAMAESEGLRCTRLAVSAPFHCALMEPAAKRLAEALNNVSFNTPNIPVYMNIDGKKISNGSDIPELLIRQAMSPVRWVQTLENMYADGIDTFIECGTGKTLSGLVKKTLKDVKILRVENMKTLKSTLEELSK